MPLPRLHLITDADVLRDPEFVARAEAVLDGCGPDVALHLRGHGTSGRLLHDVGERIAAAALRSGAWLFVNDRVDVAMATRAQGVQLGMHSMPIPDARALLGRGAWIGYSAHAALEAARAEADGADYIVAGTIFDSASHAGRRPAGVGLISACAAAVRAPIVAIGGIAPEHIGALVAAGAYGVAVISGVWRTPDPTAASAAYVAALHAQLGEPAAVKGAVD